MDNSYQKTLLNRGTYKFGSSFTVSCIRYNTGSNKRLSSVPNETLLKISGCFYDIKKQRNPCYKTALQRAIETFILTRDYVKKLTQCVSLKVLRRLNLP